MAKSYKTKRGIKRTAKKKAKKYARRNRGGYVSLQRRKVVKLEPAALNYLKALANPFDEFEVPPSVPSMISVPSQKLTMRARGILSCDSAGRAWITFNPWVGPLSGNGSSTYYGSNSDFAAPIMTSNPGVSNAAATPSACQVSLKKLNEATDPTSATNSHTDVAKNYFSKGVITLPNLAYALDGALMPGANMNYMDYKVVGAGIRLKYVGREDAKAGRVFLYEDPLDEGSLVRQSDDDSSLRDFSRLGNDLDSTKMEPLGYEHVVTQRPRRDVDLNWSSDWGYTTGTAVPDLAKYHTLAIMVDGVGDVVNQGKIIWECVAHYEMQGSLATNTTHSPPDTGFLGKVLGSFSGNPTGGTSNQHWNEAFNNFASTLTSYLV